MAHLLYYCSSCRAYTLKLTCPRCSKPAGNPHPHKYSPEDKLARYRRAEKYGAGAGIRVSETKSD